MSSYDYVRIGLAVPLQQLGDVRSNLENHLKIIEEAIDKGVQVLSFPELSLTGYSLGDLFHQQVLQETVLKSLIELERVAEKYRTLFFAVGAPFIYQGTLYNTAMIYGDGRLLAIIPKSYLPSYDEFKESIYFHPAPDKTRKIRVRGIKNEVIFGTQVIFECRNERKLRVGVEICEDLWAVIPPSQKLTLNGASIILNISASNELEGKSDYRRGLVKYQSDQCKTIYAYTSCGVGETTTDILFSGQTMVYESGDHVAELPQYSFENSMLVTDVDVGRIENHRIRDTVWAESVNHKNHTDFVKLEFTTKKVEINGHTLLRTYSRHPLVPEKKRFQEIYDIQRHALAMRVRRAKAEKLVLGVSGGADSSYALLVCVGVLDLLDWEKDRILPVTMPSIGTSAKTLGNIRKLAKSLGLNLKEIDISAQIQESLNVIEHDGSADLVLENTQARIRYTNLFNLANKENGLVVGTGDLSELALGWMTYSGDHLSHYAINAGLSKTLILAMLKWYSENFIEVKGLKDVLDTPISTELLPLKGGEIAQKTEELLGPYEVHDFYLYHFIANRFPPSKILYLAENTFEYSAELLKKWLKIFLTRFFRNQFKRSASPDGIKIGAISLSPRSQWRMPSDAQVTTWLEELDG